MKTLKYADYREAMMQAKIAGQLDSLFRAAEADETIGEWWLDKLRRLCERRKKEIFRSSYCWRRKCRYWRDPGRYGMNSCDYMTITGKSRIAQIPDRRLRRDFAHCPLYDDTRPEPKPKPPAERDRVLYDWERGRALYDAGYTDREISETLGCTREAVKWWRRKQHLPAHGKR